MENKILTYQEINKAHQDKVGEILKANGVFFAFSDAQFHENKTPLEDGDKYVSIGAGGYMPKSKAATFWAEMEAANKEKNAQVRASRKSLEDAIKYELANHECWYTGDISDVVEMFKGTATKKQIFNVYKKYYHEFV